MQVFVINGVCIGKTNREFQIPAHVHIEQFDPTNETHIKAKFLAKQPSFEERQIREKIDVYTMIDWLHDLLVHMQFLSPERNSESGRLQIISRSELRRLFEQNAIKINGKMINDPNQLFEPINSLVLFPNNNKRVTTIY